MTGTPVMYPVAAQFSGIAKDLGDGVPVAMSDNLLTNNFMYVDTPVWLNDNSFIGSMASDGNITQGVLYCAVTGGGQVFTDTFGYLLANILGDVVTTGTASPFTHAISLLNPTSGAPTAQPGSHTLTAYDGVAASSGARQIASSALSQLVIDFDAAASLLTYTFSANGFKSVIAGSRPTSAPSGVKPIAGWRGTMGLGGTAVGAPVANLASAKITINREIENEFMANGTQNPLGIGRGALTAAFDATFLAQDETVYNDMINNTKPQTQFLFNLGSTQQIQIDAQSTAYEVTKKNMGSKMVRWDCSGVLERNSTNAGASGGLSPLKVTLVNAIASGHYN